LLLQALVAAELGDFNAHGGHLVSGAVHRALPALAAPGAPGCEPHPLLLPWEHCAEAFCDVQGADDPEEATVWPRWAVQKTGEPAWDGYHGTPRQAADATNLGDSYSRQAVVEQMLRANAALVERLAS